MNAKLSRMVVVLTIAIILSLLWTAPVFAQQAAESPMAADQWMPMEDHLPHWYKFTVVGQADKEESDSLVTIYLATDPLKYGGFEVYRPGNHGYWGQKTHEDWLGVGTRTDSGGTLWAGKLVPGAYYVRITADGAQKCRLGVTGESVFGFTYLDLKPETSDTFVLEPNPSLAADSGPQSSGASFQLAANPGNPANPAPVEQMAAEPAALPETNPVQFVDIEPAAPAEPANIFKLAATAPANLATAHAAEMEMAFGEWMPMGHEPHWFNFYVGQVEDDTTNRVSVSLQTSPFGGGQFQIFRPDKASSWRHMTGAEWFGHSVESSYNMQTWSGELAPGAYTIRVEPRGAKDCLLAVTGQAVTY